MYCIIKCTVQGKEARVKNAVLRHPSCTVVMQKRKSASPVLNVLISNRSVGLLPNNAAGSAFLAVYAVQGDASDSDYCAGSGHHG